MTTFKDHQLTCPTCRDEIYPCALGMSLIPKVSLNDIAQIFPEEEQIDAEWAIMSFMTPQRIQNN